MASHIERRKFLATLGGAAVAWPLAARAQQALKVPTIGFLGQSTPAAESQRFAALVQRLRELGWIEARTVAIEYRWAEGRAAEFVRLKVDIMVTSGTSQVLAAKQATSVIPIVFATAGGPGWEQSGRELGATGRQRHRPVEPDDRHRWQEA
jgi:putative ABC transport system substrate-binding protein